MFQAGLLKDKSLVITGGGSGLGAEMARRFAELGAHCVLLGRRKEKLDEVAAQIERAGGKATTHSCDVRDFAAVQEVAARIPRVDGLVNNAAGNFLAAAEDLSANGF
jgi:NAD(P)-dependent dehydrogenase (short-subunit alcohol dehydrogenase family)